MYFDHSALHGGTGDGNKKSNRNSKHKSKERKEKKKIKPLSDKDISYVHSKKDVTNCCLINLI